MPMVRSRGAGRLDPGLAVGLELGRQADLGYPRAGRRSSPKGPDSAHSWRVLRDQVPGGDHDGDDDKSNMSQLSVDIHLPLDRFELAVELTTSHAVTGIFGPSGSGKTSLLEAVAGLRPVVQGRVELDGLVWLDSTARRSLPPERRDIGYVPQDGLLFPHLDVRQNLLASARGRRSRGHDPPTLLARVVELLELAPLLDRYPATLSGGERQRVALGRALCSAPRLLLLDEPLASLDLPLRRRLLPLLARVRDELTVPMLLVSHDPIEVQALCDELLVLREGRILARGEPRAVLTDPAVFPLARETGFENVLSGKIVRHQDGTSVLELGPGVELITGRSGAEIGASVLMGLPANEILIATEKPRGISARNLLAAAVRDIRPMDRFSLVTTELAPDVPPLVVEVTDATPAELGLAVGGRVFLVIKARSCRLYGGATTAAGDDPKNLF